MYSLAALSASHGCGVTQEKLSADEAGPPLKRATFGYTHSGRWNAIVRVAGLEPGPGLPKCVAITVSGGVPVSTQASNARAMSCFGSLTGGSESRVAVEK